MKWIKTVGEELFGLFVDDGGFALAIVLWIVGCRLVLPWLAAVPVVPAIILFAGLAVIFALSATRHARRCR